MIMRLLAALLIAAIASFADYDEAWPSCEDLFTVVSAEVDQDGNAYWAIKVTPFMQDNGTDSMCQRFGACVLALIESAPQMGAVEIVNPPDEWVPSKWRWINVHKAMILADIDPFEEWDRIYSEVDYGND